MTAAVIYAKFSPFHVARVQTAHRVGRERGHRVVGIEIADTQKAMYGWTPLTAGEREYPHVTLFPDRDYGAVPYRRLRGALHEALAKIAPDVVVLPGWGVREGIAGLSWCLTEGVPRVVLSSTHAADTRQRLFKLWLKRRIVSCYQAGFVAGTRQLRYLAGLGLAAERCFVGCAVVDNGQFVAQAAPGETTHRGNEARPVLLSCVRLHPRKNLLGVLETLAERRREWTWIIAGDGPQRAEIEQRIRELDLGEQVRLLGNVGYSEIATLYHRADAYLQPSVSEPWGLAVNEAMASGLPIIVSNQCGCREDLLQEGVNGFAFDAADPASLGAALDNLTGARDRWTEMGDASRRIVAGWDLELFGRNFWSSCVTALGHLGARSHVKPTEWAIRLLL
jgi:1,2-diacylglycerol 3-alpha-glucosyltransferase